MKANEIYWGYFFYKNWKMHLGATSKGLCHVLWPNKPFRELEDWCKKHYYKARLVYDQNRLTDYISQLDAYFEGKLRMFHISLDLKGTDFQYSVWKALLDIPYGTTKSYSQIAKEINHPKAVRAVGGAIGANPVSIVVPCHRVIGKDGSLTGFGGGLDIKKELLRIEGIRDFKEKA